MSDEKLTDLVEAAKAIAKYLPRPGSGKQVIVMSSSGTKSVLSHYDAEVENFFEAIEEAEVRP